MVGQVISLGQIVVDLALQVPYVPAPGEDVFAEGQQMFVGGSYNLLYAVRQMETPAAWAGVLGTGAMAARISAGLSVKGIVRLGTVDIERDNGISVAMTDESSERTFVSTRGAECYGDVHAFEKVNPGPQDVVHISGYTFMHPIREALCAFMHRTMPKMRKFRAVFDPGPMVGQFQENDVLLLRDYQPIWSCNEEEAGVLAGRMGCAVDELARFLHAPVIVRRGKEGAIVQLPQSWRAEERERARARGDLADTSGNGAQDGGGVEKVTVPGYPAKAVDANGAGDCHTGVLCAQLLEGASIVDAVRVANVAAALAVSKRGPATCPTKDEVLAAMAMGAPSVQP